MGFLDKVKNMFTEEVEEEVKVEQVKTEPKKVEIETPIVKKSVEEPPVQRLRSFNSYEMEKEEEIKKPVFFTDNDFKDLIKEQRKSVQSEKKEVYSKHKEEQKKVETKHVFKPSPIISPVYGVLDKNYKKEDIVSKKEESYTKVDGDITIDSVRNKAYGSLEDELENTLFGKNSIFFNDKKEETNEDSIFFEELESDELESVDGYTSDYEEEQLTEQEEKIKALEDITLNIGKELDTLINKKEELVNNKKEEEIDDDLFDLIDSLYEGEDK